MRFCYHPDETIYSTNGYLSTYDEFIALHPFFPMTKGEYFDYKDGVLNLINNQGHNLPQDVADFPILIQAIEALNG